MIKTITMFRRVENIEELLNYYIREIFPLLHTIPGVIYSDIIKLESMSPDFPEEIGGIEVVMETYFESQQALTNMLESSEGMEVMKKIESVTIECEQYVYFGQFKRIPGNNKA